MGCIVIYCFLFPANSNSVVGVVLVCALTNLYVSCLLFLSLSGLMSYVYLFITICDA